MNERATTALVSFCALSTQIPSLGRGTEKVASWLRSHAQPARAHWMNAFAAESGEQSYPRRADTLIRGAAWLVSSLKRPICTRT